METVNIEYWALHSDILTFFERGGCYETALQKWKDRGYAVSYFWHYFKKNRSR